MTLIILFFLIIIQYICLENTKNSIGINKENSKEKNILIGLYRINLQAFANTDTRNTQINIWFTINNFECQFILSKSTVTFSTLLELFISSIINL